MENLKQKELLIKEHKNHLNNSYTESAINVKDYFGSIIDDEAEIMLKAVSDCRKVDLKEW